MDVLRKDKHMQPTKFFLDQDSNGHWHLVLASHREAWDSWNNLEEDNEEAWEAPSFARRIDGHPNAIEFENPVKT